MNRGTWVIDANLTFAANTRLKFEEGAVFDINQSGTDPTDVVINGDLDAGLYQIFDVDANSSISFGDGKVKMAYPQWWGALGDGDNDDAPAIQLAIDTCEVSKTNLHFPEGAYMIDTNISTTQAGGFSITGVPHVSRIHANSAMQNMFSFTTAETNNYYFIKGLYFYGDSKAECAVYGEDLSHTTFEECYFAATTDRAVYFENGWCNDFIRCKFVGNVNSIEAVTNVNILNISDCKIFDNSGVGITLTSGNCVNITGCTIEANAKCGIWAMAIRNLNIKDNYFENNDTTGVVITTPSVTVNNDIFLNGTSYDLATLSFSNPCLNVNISDNFFATTSRPIFLNAVNNATIHNNNFNAATEFIRMYNNDSYSWCWNVNIQNNLGGDCNPITIDPNTSTDAAHNLHPHMISYAPANFLTSRAETPYEFKNYFPQNFLTYETIFSVGGSLTKSAETFCGYPVFKIDYNTDSSSVWGITFNIDRDYPELLDKWVWFGCFYKWANPNDTADTDLALYSSQDGYTSSSNRTPPADWEFDSMIIKIPSSGATTFKLGWRKLGGADIAIRICRPTFTLLGNHYKSFGLDGKITYKAASIPTTGSWTAGEIVWETDAAAGAAPGWYVTTTGTFSAATDATGDTDGSTAVITGMTDTSDFYVGEYITTSAGFASSVDDENTPQRILSKTATTIMITDTSDSAEDNITVLTPDAVLKEMGDLDA